MGLLAARERARALSLLAAAVELRRVCRSTVREICSPPSCWRNGVFSSLLLGCLSVVWYRVAALFRVSSSVMFLCLCGRCVFVAANFHSSLEALGGNPAAVYVVLDGVTMRCGSVCLSLFFVMFSQLCVP